MPMIPRPAISELAFEIAILRGINPVRGEVPEPDVDPAACLELQRYMIDAGNSIEIWKQICDQEIVYVTTVTNCTSSEKTLELAIATAARDALKSLRGGE